MTDRVVFKAPLGAAGRAVERLVLRPYLERLIRDRGRFLADGGPDGSRHDGGSPAM